MVRLAFSAAVLLVACGARTGLRVDDDGDDGGTGGEGEGGGSVGGVEQIVLGGGHTCVRTKRGSVYCWGRNGSGQLGLPKSTGQSEVPVKVSLELPAKFIAAGTYHTCAILEDDRLWCWGDNQHGQLGNGGTEDAFSPSFVSLADVKALALGEQHSCAISRDNLLLYCWGGTGLGQAGYFEPSFYPRLVTDPVVGVAAGSFHTCFIREGGEVRCMGANTDGECGIPGAVSEVLPAEIPTGLEGVVATQIAAGPGRHACALVDGKLMCWGDNSTGQLGFGFVSDNEPAGFVQSVPKGRVNGFAPGTTHTCALFDDDVYCWGDNFSGQLGLTGGQRSFPAALGLSGIVAVGSGSVHSCAYASPTEIYCWGSNSFGQLGNGETSTTATLPVKVKLP